MFQVFVLEDAVVMGLVQIMACVTVNKATPVLIAPQALHFPNLKFENLELCITNFQTNFFNDIMLKYSNNIVHISIIVFKITLFLYFHLFYATLYEYLTELL